MSLPLPVHKSDSYAEAQRWRSIKGRIADTLRDRLDRIIKAVDELEAHIDHCPQCQVSEDTYKLCPTGNRLCHTMLNT